MAFEYLETLNPEQTEAVIHSGSPLLILAGAGSGKTRVITTKIAYLIQHENIQPWSILAVTFTKKAATEMKERALRLEPLASEASIKTFHSFGAWFLRRFSEEAKLDPNFTVYDEDDMTSLIVNAMPEITKKAAGNYARKIALCKDYFLTPDDDLSDIDEDGTLEKVYRNYEERLSSTGNADFGDLIMKPAQLLESDENIRRQMQHRFRVIMVDEYQDSNVAQFRLLQALSGVKEGSGTYVCVVGDDDQSIYKFRGAEVQNILKFPELFPETKIIRLERNYRSTAKILSIADAVVSHNTDRLGKTLVAERGEGTQPRLVFLPNQDKEAEFCAQIIDKAVNIKKTCHYSDFAVLYRTNAQSMGFESEFLHKKIPYVIVGSLKFWEREEIKDTLAYLSLLANPRDEIAFQRVVNKPVRGVGAKTQEKIIALAHESKDTLTEDFDLINVSGQASGALPKKAREGITDFVSVMKELKKFLQEESEKSTGETMAGSLAEEAENENLNQNQVKGADNVQKKKENETQLSVFIKKVIDDSGLADYHKANDENDGTSRVENMEELVNHAVLYPCSVQGLLDFLDTIQLDRNLSENTEETNDAVTLITLHNTKGLEFPRVIITGLENGIFPREDKYGSDLEEERRLFYVGITRAKDKLYITTCGMRRLYGHTEAMMPSKFLKECGDQFKILGNPPLSWTMAGGEGTDESAEENPKLEVLKKYKKGTKLFHDDYGYGVVVNASADSGEVVIDVKFENGGMKKFLPEYQGRSLEIIKD